MEGEYDVIIAGTGLKECILSGLLAVGGKKVLHVDRNHYYGGESASLNLKDLYSQLKPEANMDEEKLGKSKYYNVDLCPKFIMACGNLVKILLYTRVTSYLQFKVVFGSFVYKDKTIHKVPSTPSEALSSSLMGIFQKNRYRNFLKYVSQYQQEDPATHQGMDATKMTTRQVFDYFKLDENTMAFSGHAVALHVDDDYLSKPFADTLKKLQLYAYSVSQHGSSPYVYPVYGLGGLPEGFSRLAAVHNGVYMLRQPIDEILYDENGSVCGVRAGDQSAKCKTFICDPSYVPDSKKQKVGKVARWLFVLNHPVNHTMNAHSAQIIIPFKHSGRKTDVYISVIGSEHQVCAKGKYLAMISGYVETDNPKKELEFALPLLGEYEEEFFYTTDLYHPADDGLKDRVFVTKSYDATSHFESATNEVIELYERITQEKLDLSKPIHGDDLNED